MKPGARGYDAYRGHDGGLRAATGCAEARSLAGDDPAPQRRRCHRRGSDPAADVVGGQGTSYGSGARHLHAREVEQARDARAGRSRRTEPNRNRERRACEAEAGALRHASPVEPSCRVSRTGNRRCSYVQVDGRVLAVEGQVSRRRAKRIGPSRCGGTNEAVDCPRQGATSLVGQRLLRDAAGRQRVHVGACQTRLGEDDGYRRWQERDAGAGAGQFSHVRRAQQRAVGDDERRHVAVEEAHRVRRERARADNQRLAHQRGHRGCGRERGAGCAAARERGDSAAATGVAGTGAGAPHLQPFRPGTRGRWTTRRR